MKNILDDLKEFNKQINERVIAPQHPIYFVFPKILVDKIGISSTLEMIKNKFLITMELSVVDDFNYVFKEII